MFSFDRREGALRCSPSRELAGLPTVVGFLFFFLSLAIVTPVSAQGTRIADAAALEQRVALIIGNAAYQEAPLKNPLNDARRMGAELQKLAFDVTLVENASGRQMQRAILDFGQKLKAGGAGLFYYAGHGLQVKGRNYLVPVDAAIDSEAAVRVEAVDVELVTEQLGDAAARVSIVILDACRDNPFERKLRGGSRGLAAIDAAKGTLIAYATAPGSVAADGTGENGVYTEELLKALQPPGLKVEEVFKRVRSAVVQRTRGRQTPWESSSLTGDFVFHLTINVPPPVVSGFDERQIELAYWSGVKDSTDPQDFEEFLHRFPNGSFRPLAERSIRALQRAAASRILPHVQSKAAEDNKVDSTNNLSSNSALIPAKKPLAPAWAVAEIKRKSDEAARLVEADKHTRVQEAGRSQQDQSSALQVRVDPKGPATEPLGTVDEAIAEGKKALDHKDYIAAMRWYRSAADRGNVSGQHLVGWLHHNGWGVPQDHAEAMRWYRKAAEQGSASAQNNIGLLYLNGLSVVRDYDEAMRWYRKAADQGNAFAQNNIGFLYRTGRGVTRDYGEAMRWHRKAADQGHALGQWNIAHMYAMGLGVPQDRQQARTWAEKSAAQGNESAKKWLAEQ